MRTHCRIPVPWQYGWRRIGMHASCQRDQELEGRCPSLLIHLLDAQHDLPNQRRHHLHALVSEVSDERGRQFMLAAVGVYRTWQVDSIDTHAQRRNCSGSTSSIMRFVIMTLRPHLIECITTYMLQSDVEYCILVGHGTARRRTGNADS